MKILKNKYFIGFLIIILGAAAYFIFKQPPQQQYITAKVKRGGLIQTVSETGMVKAGNEVSLNFPAAGKIAIMAVKVGDGVKQDQILAELDNSDLFLKQREAEANLRVAQANLAKLLAGATAADIAVRQAGVDQAEAAHASALNEQEKIKAAVEETIAQAQKSLNDFNLTSGLTITSYQQDIKNDRESALSALEAKLPLAVKALDNINTILNDADAKNFLGAGNSALIATVKGDYNQSNLTLTSAQNDLTSAKSSQTEQAISRSADSAINALNQVFDALKNTYSLLEVSLAGGNFSQTDLDGYKTVISAQQTTISDGLTSLRTARQNLADAINDLNNAILAAKNTLATAQVNGAQQTAAAQEKVDSSYQSWQLAQTQLTQLKDGPRPQDVSLSQAQLGQAQAALGLVINQINNNKIKAPFDGVITKKNYEAGEQFSLSKPVFSILGENAFEIEVDVSEADIAKVAVGQQAAVTLDAFGEDVKFQGQVSFIEPAETVIQDVIYYKVKINFDGLDKPVKSGMTANLDITTARRDDILIIPSRAVIEKNGGDKFARLLVNNQISEAPVTIGLRGDDGLAEIISGLKEGDEVVTFIQQN
ncbi:MAG: efflux RND transporter periplasmic adaptor subunit [bacterium]|nr:efflux RND transporter periplasmic adaptor subunit [bacterium]